MSSVYTSSITEEQYSLDRPLVVKCSFDQKRRRITFGSARNCSYGILRQRVEKCFSLSGTEYKIIWKDDDGENWVISEDGDLGDAISYFASEEPPLPSNASLISEFGSNSSSKKVTVHVTIQIDYDGPSLSETSSIASREEYDLSSSSSVSSVDFSSISRPDLDDDEVTVSSKITSSRAATNRLTETPVTVHPIAESDYVHVESEDPFVDLEDTATGSQTTSGPFERLKSEDPTLITDSGSTLLRSERGVAWLRDQKSRTIKSMLGALPEPSDQSADASDSQLDVGELSLQQDPSGKYYYSYNSASSSSLDSSFEETRSMGGGSIAVTKYRPTSMDLAWFEGVQGSSSNTQHPLRHGFVPNPAGPVRDSVSADIPPELLPFITASMNPQPPEELTTCSQCDAILDSIRYVCSTCNQKKARAPEDIETSRIPGKGKDPWLYPPPAHRSSRFLNGYMDDKPIPLLSDGTPDPGYELCPSCLESAGVTHALEMSLAPGSSPSPTSPENALSLWRRTAPTNKGQLRHAYLEKAWGPKGWQDVQQDELYDPHCSTCNSVISGRRYKCASCIRFNLCKGCYSQVHMIHPSHAFLVVVDKPKATYSRSESDLLTLTTSETNGLQSMQHPDVKCSYCFLDIVGARFHCVVCESVDICSNCESAGLPGNLDSSDGGHNNSHIMIKIPYPLESSKVQAASHQAMLRWNGGDADSVRSQTLSRRSSWEETVRMDPDELQARRGHGVNCDSCSQPIVGVRYQCANCPSRPKSYNLCWMCEEKSYIVHDPKHVFFKFPRPVDRPVESIMPVLPKLYKRHAGPSDGHFNAHNPKDYLRALVHSTAYCDLHMTKIQGEWFHCVYCERDLCDNCEAIDTHDEKHFFVVFKGEVEMTSFLKYFNQPDNAPRPPVVPYPVYL